MNIWDVLGIEPTSSARAIKRAYARQLAKHHPEDDPEGFQLVQAAYERALLIARGGEAASEEVATALCVNASAEAGAEVAATSAAGEPTASMPAAPPPAVPRPRIAHPGGVFADVAAEVAVEVEVDAGAAEDAARAGVAAGSANGRAAGASEPDYIREKMLRDIRHREDALRWIDDLDHDLNSSGDALAALRRRPAAQYMDVDGADQAAANLLRPYISRMRRRDLDQLEGALGSAAKQDALRALFARRRAEYAKHRRDALGVLASAVAIAVFLSLRVWQTGHTADLRQEARQNMEQMTQDVLERQDPLDSEGLSFGVPIATQDEKRALEAAAEANRAEILDYLRQAFGTEFTLEEDPSFVPGHTDTVMAIALDPAGRRYAVMADVDEDFHVSEIRSAVEVDEEGARVRENSL